MKILLDIPATKASALIDVLRSIPYLNGGKLITDKKPQFLGEVGEVVDEIKLLRSNEENTVFLIAMYDASEKENMSYKDLLAYINS